MVGLFGKRMKIEGMKLQMISLHIVKGQHRPLGFVYMESQALLGNEM